MPDNDREEGSAVTDDWTTDEYLAIIAAEELSDALASHGVRLIHASVDEGAVDLAFKGISEAAQMLSLVFDGPQGPESLYDRATGSCVRLGYLAEKYGEGDVPEDKVVEAVDDGWVWMIHPAMQGSQAGWQVGWHTTVTIPAADAMAVTALLNQKRNGGAV